MDRIAAIVLETYRSSAADAREPADAGCGRVFALGGPGFPDGEAGDRGATDSPTGRKLEPLAGDRGAKPRADAGVSGRVGRGSSLRVKPNSGQPRPNCAGRGSNWLPWGVCTKPGVSHSKADLTADPPRFAAGVPNRSMNAWERDPSRATPSTCWPSAILPERRHRLSAASPCERGCGPVSGASA
jgi:hypothetical protein